MQVELKSCPFCGGAALIGETLDDTWYAMCGFDDCCVLESYWPTKDEAIATWNHRHQARAEVVGEIVAWLRMNAMSGHTLAAQIEDKFGEAGND